MPDACRGLLKLPTWGSPLSRSGDCIFAQRGPGAPEVLIAGTFSEVPSARILLPGKPRTLRVNGSEIIAGHQGLRGYSRHFFFFSSFSLFGFFFLLFKIFFLFSTEVIVGFTVLCLF